MIRFVVKYILFKLYMCLTCRLSFLHYYILSRKIVVPQFSDKGGIFGNYCYGNRLAVKNALGKDYRPDCMIEHGIYFGRNVLENECVYPEISTIYTYSPYREEVLREHFGVAFDKEIITVGPYLIHAVHLLSKKKINKLKNKWGKVLVVFPSHSSPEGKTTFDYNTWLKEIKKRSIGYETVVICLFWLDYYNGNYSHYQKEGYKFACCGNRFDEHFLSRLKDLISLADMTMSNDLGTHIGYCVAMGKPHYVYQQTIAFDAYDNKDKSKDVIKHQYEKEKREILSYFSQFEERITEEQRKIVSYYWGKF